ncbi:MAG: SDR family oxidoreductase [Proteobacteria bacterium]|nr:SDR family oxidoreductase [Pseudomonadota bacterium]
MEKQAKSQLDGKTALVTGASRGLGRAVAMALGEAGANVVVTDLLIEDDDHDMDELAAYSPLAAHFAQNDSIGTLATAKEIHEMGVESLGLKMDVTQADEVRAVVSEADKTFGGIDILVNNAAVMDNISLLEYQTLSMWERDLKVNLTGAFNCTTAVWEGMKEKGWGRIINISSFTADAGAFGQPGYGATKAGLVGMSRTLALEGAKFNITVNAVLPGFIETETVKLYEPDKLERIKRQIAMKRLGKPEEIAHVVAFLASDLSSYVTGAAIPVTGGAELFVF